MRLKDKIAIVTGGGAGIGRAGVDAFLKEGARVMIAEKNPAFLDRLTAEMADFGDRVAMVETDVTDRASVENCIEATVRTFGTIDILYNNAGGSLMSDGTILTSEVDGFWDSISLNLFGTWYMCRCAAPVMIKGGGGAIVNTASTAAFTTIPRVEFYSAAKAGVVQMTKTMASALAEHKIRVNAVAPGRTNTERTLAQQSARKAAGLKPPAGTELFGRAEPSDIADMAVFLASDESRKITGHTIPVDSGYLL